MRLQSKINLGIALVFMGLATGTGWTTFTWQTDHALKAAENRVALSIKAAWEVYDGRLEWTQALLVPLTDDPDLVALLQRVAPSVPEARLRGRLETLRREQGMDLLTVYDTGGRVVWRAHEPERHGDAWPTGPLVRKALGTQQAASGTILLSEKRLAAEGDDLVAVFLRQGGEPKGMLAGAAVPVKHAGRVLGVVEMGKLLNGAVDKVGRIRDSIFENEEYAGRPVGTATIFMGDRRISTNVRDELGELSESFNRMAEQLRSDTEEIRTGREALQKANEDLGATNRNYLEMLGFVSHETKAPLSSAILSLHTVRDGYLGPLSEAQAASISCVASSLDLLNEMVKHYLDLSRLEKGELRVRKSWVPLYKEIEKVLGPRI